MNSSGEALLQFCKLMGMHLSNTHFQHKLAHITTWESPERHSCKGPDDQPRRNPFRNQIDYILVPRKLMHRVVDCRSYSGINTYTDHRLVILEIRLSMKKNYCPNKKPPQIDYLQLKNPAVNAKYKSRVSEEMEKTDRPTNIQERLDKIARIQKDVALEVIGPKPTKHQKPHDPEIGKLSEHQKN